MPVEWYKPEGSSRGPLDCLATEMPCARTQMLTELRELSMQGQPLSYIHNMGIYIHIYVTDGWVDYRKVLHDALKTSPLLLMIKLL